MRPLLTAPAPGESSAAVVREPGQRRCSWRTTTHFPHLHSWHLFVERAVQAWSLEPSLLSCCRLAGTPKENRILGWGCCFRSLPFAASISESRKQSHGPAPNGKTPPRKQGTGTYPPLLEVIKHLRQSSNHKKAKGHVSSLHYMLSGTSKRDLRGAPPLCEGKGAVGSRDGNMPTVMPTVCERLVVLRSFITPCPTCHSHGIPLGVLSGNTCASEGTGL